MSMKGMALIALLTQKEINVTTAAWVKTSEKRAWYLYIATDEVEEEGSVRRLPRSLRRSQLNSGSMHLAI